MADEVVFAIMNDADTWQSKCVRSISYIYCYEGGTSLQLRLQESQLGSRAIVVHVFLIFKRFVFNVVIIIIMIFI